MTQPVQTHITQSQQETHTRSRGEFILFVAVASTLLVGWFILNTTTFMEVQSGRFAQFIAQLSGGIAGVFTDPVQVVGTTITGFGFAVDIRYGCDALEPMALLTAVILAYRSPLIHKIIGLPVGLCIVFIINQLRIFSLMLAQLHVPSLFDILHVDIWQPLFVVIALVIFALWLAWSHRYSNKRQVSF
jgi:exosortase/archaeosortase family protein